MHTKIILLVFILALLPVIQVRANNAVDLQIPTGLRMDELSGIPKVASSSLTEGLYDQILKAKKQLEPVNLNYATTPVYSTPKATARVKNPKKVLSHYSLDIKDIALAVFDPTTNQIHTVMAMQRGTEFEFPPQYRNFDIEKKRFNGVNTNFEVHKPIGGKVLALKYLITPKESGSIAEIKAAMYSGVYVPYSPALLDDEVSLKGAAYLDSVVTQAALELSGKPSVSSAGKTIPEAITPELVKALIYAEHMDTSEFLLNPDTEHLVKKINILLAGNQGDTWKYSVSSAGAAGISQFIPSTYTGLVKRHPDAKLIPDFVTGMRNHVNAVKSTFILLDDYILAVRVRAPEHFLAGHAFDYAVAAYNGGPARVAGAAKAFGAYWYDHNWGHEKALRNETVNYVLKIHRLMQHLQSKPDNVVAVR